MTTVWSITHWVPKTSFGGGPIDADRPYRRYRYCRCCLVTTPQELNSSRRPLGYFALIGHKAPLTARDSVHGAL